VRMSDQLFDQTDVHPLAAERSSERRPSIANVAYVGASIVSTIGWCWLLVRAAMSLFDKL
jgi:hypothetical protein